MGTEGAWTPGPVHHAQEVYPEPRTTAAAAPVTLADLLDWAHAGVQQASVRMCELETSLRSVLDEAVEQVPESADPPPLPDALLSVQFLVERLADLERHIENVWRRVRL